MTDPQRPTDLTCDDVRDLAGSFVLGALPSDEADAVRAHLATCPEAHAEIAELGSVVPVLDLDAASAAMEPSAALKGRILAAAAAEPNVATASVVSSTPAAPAPAPALAAVAAEPIPFPSADERTQRTDAAAARSGASPLAWILRIAAVLAIVALTGWNLLLQGQLTDAQRYEQNVAAVVEAARQPGSVAAILSPDTGTGSGIAAITATGDIAMALQDLAPTTGGQVYEVWIIGSDQVPVALGSLEVGRAGTAFMNGETVPATPGLVLALTLEPGPGATSPSGPVITKGVATATG